MTFENWWATVETEYTSVVDEDVARSAFEAGKKEAASECCQLVADRLYNGAIIGMAAVMRDAYCLEI